ncbi:MAG: 7-cyano-7-deazaguanine synthase, partial [Candidatus Omnitrophota bacterium]
MVKKAVLILSGGMDSVTLLYHIIAEGYTVFPISFDYGQKHRKELECAKQICKDLQLVHKVVSIPALNDLAPSSQTRKDIEVPEGKYDDDNMKQTVVPNRNMVMLSLAASYAISINAGV